MRPDLLPPAIAAELAKLQDQVPPFAGEQAAAALELAFGRPVEQVFAEFDRTPLAAASIAQVHAARLPDGRAVVVKILRPNVAALIQRDVEVLYVDRGARGAYWPEARRLHPVEVVAEFERTLAVELDLMREAANAAQLEAQFRGLGLAARARDLLGLLPAERADDRAHRRHPSRRPRRRCAPRAPTSSGSPRTASRSSSRRCFATISFTPTCTPATSSSTSRTRRGRSTSPSTSASSARSTSATSTISPRIFSRSSAATIAASRACTSTRAWVPAGTRVDELEAAVRAVCEPIFNKPIKDISFGVVLLRLFQTARQFNMEIQPQLVLLQKTMLADRGLGQAALPRARSVEDGEARARAVDARAARSAHALEAARRGVARDQRRSRHAAARAASRAAARRRRGRGRAAPAAARRRRRGAAPRGAARAARRRRGALDRRRALERARGARVARLDRQPALGLAVLVLAPRRG